MAYEDRNSLPLGDAFVSSGSFSRYTRSSKKTPCPVCSRTKSNSCSWNNDVIYCHQGSTNSPPQHLRIGDCLEIDGKKWALVSKNAGFTGSAYCFRPDRGKVKNTPRGISKRHKKELVLLVKELFALVELSLAVMEFMTDSPEVLKRSLYLIDSAFSQCKEARQSLKEMVPHDKKLKPLLMLVDDALKQLGYQKQDSDYFRKHYLGERNGEL